MKLKRKIGKMLVSEYKLVLMISFFILVLMSLVVYTKTHLQAADPAERVVRLLYEFDEPQDIPGRVLKAREFVDEDSWGAIDFDDPLRVVNAYYKFQSHKTRVQVVYATEGVVCYRLINQSISPDIIWVFRYELTKEGKLRNIREYRLIRGFEEGADNFVWDDINCHRSTSTCSFVAC